MGNKGLSAIAILGFIIGTSGLVLGTFSVINFQLIEGLEGPPGEDGLIVRILDPNHGEHVSGNVTIRALVYGSEDYSISILKNGTEIGTSLPFIWETRPGNFSLLKHECYNLTIVVKDLETNKESRDEVRVFVQNPSEGYINNTGAFYYWVFGPYNPYEIGDDYMIDIFFEGVPYSGSIEYYSLELIIQWYYLAPLSYWFNWLNVSEVRYPGSPKINCDIKCPNPAIMPEQPLGLLIFNFSTAYEFVHYTVRYIIHP